MFNFQGPSERVGHNNAEGPPVPIPNTEVKLCGADSTVLETVREGRTWPTPRPEKVASPWGCSSDGRAPALQAGGHGFESHHLHQGTRRVPSRRRDSNKSGVNDSPVDCQSRRDAGASSAAKESHHLHQGARRVPSRRRDSNKSGGNDSPADCQSRRDAGASRAAKESHHLRKGRKSQSAGKLHAGEPGGCPKSEQRSCESEWRNRKGSGLIAQQVRARA